MSQSQIKENDNPELYNLSTLILSDFTRYKYRNIRKIDECSKIKFLKLFLIALVARNHSFTYSFWWRLVTRKNILRPLALFMHYRLSRSYGIQIPKETKIGPGLYLGHGLCIVINGGTRIGSFCNISHFVSIGTNKGTPATIGSNVYIGPNVSIVENVVIGNNVKIGAGTVVVNSIPDETTSVGNPNRIIVHD